MGKGTKYHMLMIRIQTIIIKIKIVICYHKYYQPRKRTTQAISPPITYIDIRKQFIFWAFLSLAFSGTCFQPNELYSNFFDQTDFIKFTCNSLQHYFLDRLIWSPTKQALNPRIDLCTLLHSTNKSVLEICKISQKLDLSTLMSAHLKQMTRKKPREEYNSDKLMAHAKSVVFNGYALE